MLPRADWATIRLVPDAELVEQIAGCVVHFCITLEVLQMPVSVRLDSKTESLIGRLARKRGQSKSEVIRDAIGVLAKQEENGAEKKRPYDLVAHLIGCVKGGPKNLSVKGSKKFHEMLVERARKRR